MGGVLRKLKKNVVISAVLCIVLGLVLAIWPGMSMHIVCIAIGSVLILGGLVRLAESFFDRDSSMYAQMNMIVGIIFAVVGIWIVIKPEKVLAIIPIIVGIVIAVHGLNNLQQAVSLCKEQYDK